MHYSVDVVQFYYCLCLLIQSWIVKSGLVAFLQLSQREIQLEGVFHLKKSDSDIGISNFPFQMECSFKTLSFN